MDLSVTYLGLKLRSPLAVSASPLTEDLSNIRRMEDAGAGAVVFHSLFEEQLALERLELAQHLEAGTESFAESLSYFPEAEEYRLGPEEYLEQIQKAKAAVSMPVIASLNGSSLGGWTDYARQLQQAGADAIELNIYYIPTDLDLPGSEVEKTYVEILRAVKKAVTIPVAVKLSPYFSNPANMAKRLDDAGADGLVLFNRFYQPDINLDDLKVEPHILLSTPMALRPPMRWVAILSGRLRCDLAATSGIHWAKDAIKLLMCGAKATFICSAILRHGIEHIRTIEQGMVEWMKENEYESVAQMQGCLSQVKCPDPSAFERAQYMRALTSYRPS